MVLLVFLALLIGFLLGYIYAIWYVIEKLKTHEAYLSDAGRLGWKARE